MTSMWFIVQWSIDGQMWSGPFESEDAAVQHVDGEGLPNKAFDYVGVVGPLPFRTLTPRAQESTP